MILKLKEDGNWKTNRDGSALNIARSINEDNYGEAYAVLRNNYSTFFIVWDSHILPAGSSIGSYANQTDAMNLRAGARPVVTLEPSVNIIPSETASSSATPHHIDW